MGTLSGIKLKRFLKHRYNHDFEIVAILENVQYARNVAEVFRIADATKLSKVYLTGISQQPPFGKDLQKVSRSKERSLQWEYQESTDKVIKKLKKQGFQIIALEISEDALELPEYLEAIPVDKKVAIVVGNEGYGITKTTLNSVDTKIMLPMYGKGASLNVSVSLAIMLYFLILN